MTYQTSGTYYYTGTGSVANVTGSATNQSYSYTTGGSMTAFAMSASAGVAGNTTSTLTTNPTAYGTYGFYGYNGEYTHTSLGLQYLRARYLNVATGTFTSRDTYAGKLQDILSQNRYTYAENNPIGHSDPSGHAVSTIIGGLARNLKATVGNVQNRIHGSAKSSNSSTGARALVATANSVLTYVNEQRQKLPSNKVDGSEANVSWPAIIAQNLERAMCESYEGCVNYTQEKIQYVKLETGAVLLKSENQENNIENIPEVYAEPIAGFIEKLPAEQQISNAEYIHMYLLKRGWTTEAICGLLGNITVESYLNPASSQKDIGETFGTGNGYGIVHWDAPEDKFLLWAERNKSKVNEMAENDPKELMDLQLEYLIASSIGEDYSGKNVDLEWYLFGGEMTQPYTDYISSTDNASDLAISFCQSYERTGNGYDDRRYWADAWYGYFNDNLDIEEVYEEKGF